MGGLLVLKPKRCPICRDTFTPARTLQKVCSPACAAKDAERKRERAQARMAREATKTARQRLESMKGIPELVREAQKAFNAFIRERDSGLSCISCGQISEQKRGGTMECGHYRSTGAAPQHRFNELNAHLQCSRCNRYMSGNVVEYRRNLVERIGLERVEALESDNKPHKWSRDELRAIRDDYRRKLRELVKSRQ